MTISETRQETAAKEREWDKTPLGAAFRKFESAHAHYWQMDGQDHISDRTLREADEKQQTARREFLALLRGKPESDAAEAAGWKPIDGFVIVPREPTIEMLNAMPNMPAIKLPVLDELKNLTPTQYCNRVRWLAAVDAVKYPLPAQQKQEG